MSGARSGVAVTELVIVRHGETEANRLGIFRGRLDVALNENGRAQARALGEALAAPPIEAVFSSPLARALDTARAVASVHGIEPECDPAFNNIDLGEWQGVEKERVRREQPDAWRLWQTNPDDLEIPGGESLSDVRARAQRRALELVSDFAGSRIVIVTHRSVAKLLAGALLGMESGYFWKFYLDNAGYSLLGHGRFGFVLLKWNEACHLPDRVVEEF